jgi:hypothetical protein
MFLVLDDRCIQQIRWFNSPSPYHITETGSSPCFVIVELKSFLTMKEIPVGAGKVIVNNLSFLSPHETL